MKKRRMTKAQTHRVCQLIRRLCANYDGGNCLLLDDGETCICPQSITNALICRYFRTAVLPSDRELYAEIMKTGRTKYCFICGTPISAGSNSAKYCRACAIRERRRRDRVRKAKAALNFRK